MLSYPNPPRLGNGVIRVCCSKCGEPSKGYYYCFRCRRKHAARAKLYMRARRQDETFRAAERVKTKLRMRRLRAALGKAELDALRVNNANRRSRSREHQFVAGLGNWHGDLTEKQMNWLVAIHSRLQRETSRTSLLWRQETRGAFSP